MKRKGFLSLILLPVLLSGCGTNSLSSKNTTNNRVHTSNTVGLNDTSAGNLTKGGKPTTSTKANSLGAELNTAAGSGNVALVKSLLNQGVSPNVTDSSGLTPLINCAFTATNPDANDGPANEIVGLLLQHGANPNAQDDSGDTAISFAVSANDLQMVKLLLNAGANPNIANKSGISAMYGVDPSSPIGQLLKSAQSTNHNTENNATTGSWITYQAGSGIETFSAPRGWKALVGAVSADNDGVWALDNSGDQVTVTGVNSQNKYIAIEDYVSMYHGSESPITLSNGRSAAIYQYDDGQWQHYGIVTTDGNYEMDFQLTQSYFQSNKDTLTKVLQSFNITTTN